MLRLATFVAVLGAMFTSCSNDDGDVNLLRDFKKGAFVLNEGSDHSTISFIEEGVDTVAHKVYELINDVSLGQYTQSIALSEKYLLIAVTTGNGAGYVEVVDNKTLIHVATFAGLSYPREITVDGTKAYVSNGSGEGIVLTIDLETLVMDKVPVKVGKGPEKMLVSKGKLFVANSGGNSNDDKTVSVIDLTKKEVVKTIEVKSCPKDMVLDKDGNVWVYCAGVPDYSNWPNTTITNSGLSKIASDYSVTNFDIGGIATSGIKNIAISPDKTTVYYITDGVYKMDYQATAVPATKFISTTKTLYGIDVNPENGEVYLCSLNGYTSPGNVTIYATDGSEQETMVVGVIPNSCMFKTK